MKNLTIRFLRDNKGVTALEYGLIAGLIAVAIATQVSSVGTALSGVFTTIATKITASNPT
jgi:pilus assembly protein Flp/PilA